MHRHLITALSLCLVSPVLAAQPDQPDPLRGPDVPARETRSLVNRGMMGRFEPLEVRPVAAALLELDLDDATREKAREIVEQRALDIAMLLVDRIDLVRDMTDLIMAGDRDAARRMLHDMWGEFEPDAPRDPLLKPLKEILEPAQIGEVRRLVDEYWNAWIDYELRDQEERREKPQARERVTRRLSFEIFEREVREGYDASLSRYRQALDAVYNAVMPTDEQREAIRSIVIEHIKTTRLSATPAQRRETNMRIYRLLDDERKERLFE
ncbi:MAG: hypothetical protein K8E66_07765, partial [Phycisphaerales bacterium]|nr:hypothetical protein [Phycisphaerales bacterium]